MLRTGFGVPQDVGRAATLFQQACRGRPRSAPGCNNLGVLYRDGRGVPQDQTRATALFRNACEGGLAAGCNNFGVSLYSGRGVTANRDLAIVYLERACRAGDRDGCQNQKRASIEMAPIRYLPEPSAESNASTTPPGHDTGTSSAESDRLTLVQGRTVRLAQKKLDAGSTHFGKEFRIPSDELDTHGFVQANVRITNRTGSPIPYRDILRSVKLFDGQADYEMLAACIMLNLGDGQQLLCDMLEDRSLAPRKTEGFFALFIVPLDAKQTDITLGQYPSAGHKEKPRAAR